MSLPKVGGVLVVLLAPFSLAAAIGRLTSGPSLSAVSLPEAALSLALLIAPVAQVLFGVLLYRGAFTDHPSDS